jgi:hypothetical protein
MQFRHSKLDDKTVVVEIESGDGGELVTLLDSRGHGFAVFGEVEFPFVVIDGRLREEAWCTEAHMLAIEAHELGHIHAQSTDEPTAELAGIDILTKLDQRDAADILRGRGVI